MEVVALGSGLDVEVARDAVDHDVPAHHAAGPLVVVHSLLRLRLLAGLPRIPELLFNPRFSFPPQSLWARFVETRTAVDNQTTKPNQNKAKTKQKQKKRRGETYVSRQNKTKHTRNM